MDRNDDDDYKTAIRERALELLQNKPKKEKVERVKQKRQMSESQKEKVLERLKNARVKAREVIAQKSEIKKQLNEIVTIKQKPQPVQQPATPKPQPVQPVQQVQQVQPTQPAQPVQQVQPVQPAQSAQPAQPAQPIQQTKATYFRPTLSHYKKNFMNGF